MKKIPLVYFVIVLLFSIVCSYAQEGRVTIKANVDTCLVFIDTAYIGKAPLINFGLKPGKYMLKATTTALEIWDKQVIEKEIIIDTISSKTIFLEFKKKSRITTEPDNADIYINNLKIGKTPVNILHNPGDTIILSKANFNEIVILSDTLINRFINYKLSPVGNNPLASGQGEVKNNKNLYYALIGSGLAFGVFSVITKHRADNLEIEYRNAPSEDTKSNIRKYDLISGISLGFFEACFLSLSYLLLSD